MQTNTSTAGNDQGLNLMDLLVYLVSKWRWFALSIAVCVGIAWFNYARSPFVYYRSATVIIKDPSNKTSTTGLDRFDNIINKVNVANEILQFRSKKLMREVVQRLHADVSYQVEEGLRLNELYTQSPVLLSFPDALPEQRFSLTVTPKDKNTVELSGMLRNRRRNQPYRFPERHGGDRQRNARRRNTDQLLRSLLAEHPHPGPQVLFGVDGELLPESSGNPAGRGGVIHPHPCLEGQLGGPGRRCAQHAHLRL